MKAFPGKPVTVGLIGCGDISAEYCKNLSRHSEVELVTCADLDRDRALARAAEFDIPAAADPEEVLGEPEIELIVNLTPPLVHHEISGAAIAAGKHVFSEKPLAASLEAAHKLVDQADRTGVLIACAPDTVLGGSLQTCRKLLDDGWIGRPVAAAAFVTSHGYEHFHPRVDYYYGTAGGPALDVGPYYVSAMINLLGSARRVSGSTTRSGDLRAIPAGEGVTRQIPVEVSTHVAGTIDFDCGVVATMIASWDVWSSQLPYLEIYGDEGSLSIPNPDHFDGFPRLLRPGIRELMDDPPRSGDTWHAIPLSHRGDVGRGIGVADLAWAIRDPSVPPRASAQVALHSLELLLAFDASTRSECHEKLTSRCERPVPMPPSTVGSPIGFR